MNIFDDIFVSKVSTTAAVTAAHVFTSNGRTLQPNEMLLGVARDDLTKGALENARSTFK